MYGNTLEAFSMVQTLLAVGLPGSLVVLVQPPLQVPTCFNNPFIEDAVNAALKECGKCLCVGFFIHSHLFFFFFFVVLPLSLHIYFQSMIS